MNLVADEIALVPLGVTTVISTAPVPRGEVAVIWVSLFSVKVAKAAPNLTDVAPVNPLPVMTTPVPPASGPLFVLIPDTTGTVKYANLSASDVKLVPPRLVTVMSTVPVSPAGDVAVSLVSLIYVMLVASVVPNLTVVSEVNLLPVIVTGVPPIKGPVFGVIPDTTGTARYVNLSSSDTTLVPPGLVTVISTVPSVPVGATAVSCVVLTYVTLVASFAPNLTVVSAVNRLPEMVTEVPPTKGPRLGLTAVTTGKGM